MNNNKDTFGCTTFRKGKYFGRSYDFYCNDVASSILHTDKVEGVRYESIGMSGSSSNGLLKDKALDGTIEKPVIDALFTSIVDGINEKGVAISTLVVPKGDKGITTGTNPGKPSISARLVPRVVLDKTYSAKNAIKLLSELNIIQDWSNSEYELHWMIADSSNTYIVETVDNKLSYLGPEAVLGSLWKPVVEFTSAPLVEGTPDVSYCKVPTPPEVEGVTGYAVSINDNTSLTYGILRGSDIKTLLEYLNAPIPSKLEENSYYVSGIEDEYLEDSTTTFKWFYQHTIYDSELGEEIKEADACYAGKLEADVVTNFYQTGFKSVLSNGGSLPDDYIEIALSDEYEGNTYTYTLRVYDYGTENELVSKGYYWNNYDDIGVSAYITQGELPTENVWDNFTELMPGYQIADNPFTGGSITDPRLNENHRYLVIVDANKTSPEILEDLGCPTEPGLYALSTKTLVDENTRIAVLMSDEETYEWLSTDKSFNTFEMPITNPTVTPYGAGLERYKIVVDAIKDATLSSDEDAMGIINLVQYTNAYKADNTWYTEFVDHAKGVDNRTQLWLESEPIPFRATECYGEWYGDMFYTFFSTPPEGAYYNYDNDYSLTPFLGEEKVEGIWGYYNISDEYISATEEELGVTIEEDAVFRIWNETSETDFSKYTWKWNMEDDSYSDTIMVELPKLPSDYVKGINNLKEAYNSALSEGGKEAVRKVGLAWHSNHQCVYDLTNKTMLVYPSENGEHAFRVDIHGEVEDEAVEIGGSEGKLTADAYYITTDSLDIHYYLVKKELVHQDEPLHTSSKETMYYCDICPDKDSCKEERWAPDLFLTLLEENKDSYYGYCNGDADTYIYDQDGNEVPIIDYESEGGGFDGVVPFIYYGSSADNMKYLIVHKNYIYNNQYYYLGNDNYVKHSPSCAACSFATNGVCDYRDDAPEGYWDFVESHPDYVSTCISVVFYPETMIILEKLKEGDVDEGGEEFDENNWRKVGEAGGGF